MVGRRPAQGRHGSYSRHVPAMADGAIAQRFAGEFFVSVPIVGFVLRCNDGGQGQGHSQQLAAKGELGPTVAVAQKAVMPDALQAVGQHMQQEAANEFIDFQRHDL